MKKQKMIRLIYNTPLMSLSKKYLIISLVRLSVVEIELLPV